MPRSEGSQEPPSDEFAAACAGLVRTEHLAPLWRLHGRWRRPGRDRARHLGELLDDYRHFLLYCQSRAGDEAAASAFESHWRSYLRSLLGPSFTGEQRDELTSRFFARVYRLVGTEFHWNCPFAIYLRTIALNLARDLATSLGEQRRREASLDADDIPSTPVLASPERSPEQAAIDAETGDRIRAALAELAPADRHIVRVCLIDGGSGQDLAAELGIKRDALYQRLRRAKLKLRDRLRQLGLGPPDVGPDEDPGQTRRRTQSGPASSVNRRRTHPAAGEDG